MAYFPNEKIGIGVGERGTIMIGGDSLVFKQGYSSAFSYGKFRAGEYVDTNIINYQFTRLSASDENEIMVSSDGHRNSIIVSKDSCKSFEEIKLLEAENSKVVFIQKIGTDKYIICIDTTTKWVNGNAKKKSRFYLYSQEHLTQVYETEVEQNVDKFIIADSVFIFYRLENIYISKNYGAEWVKLNTPNNLIIEQITIDKENKIHLITEKKIYTSINYGGAWELVDSTENRISSIAFLKNGSILKNEITNSGSSASYSLMVKPLTVNEWIEIYSTPTSKPILMINELSSDRLLIISNNGIVLLSENFTKTETLSGNRAIKIDRFVNSVKINDNTIYLCAMDSIYRIRLSLDSTTDVASDIIEDDITIDSQASSGAVTIRSVDAKVLESIEVFDQNGLSVARINNIQSDSYQLNTENLSTGLYLIKIKSDGKEFHKKILKY